MHTRGLTLPIVIIVALAFVPRATAQSATEKETASWNISFDRVALASQFDVRGQTLLVVGSGDETQELQAATNALATSYRRLPGAGTVLHAGGLPALGKLDDQAIVDAAKARPVHFVVIVRVFPNSEGVLNTAVVTLYDPKGRAQHAFTATVDTPLASSSEGSHAGQGVTPRAAETISDLHDEQEGKDKDARAAYGKQFIYVPRTYRGRLPRKTFAYQGVYRRALVGADFYRAVGRDDLAKRYASRNRWRWGLPIVGTGVAIAGFAYLVTWPGCDDFTSPAYDTCSDRLTTRFLTGYALMGIGALGFFGLLINPQPIAPGAANELVAEHNDRLRKRLRLPGDYHPSQQLSMSKPRIVLTPYAGRSQAGMVLRVDF